MSLSRVSETGPGTGVWGGGAAVKVVVAIQLIYKVGTKKNESKACSDVFQREMERRQLSWFLFQ